MKDRWKREKLRGIKMPKLSASEHSLEYIRNYYKVPAFKGAKVKYKGEIAEIAGGQSAYIVLRFEDINKNGPYHPTWEIEYMEKEGGV